MALSKKASARRYYRSYAHFQKVIDEDKRTLVQAMLGGKDASGKSLGV
ncbi:MAG: hypothetical protein KKB70_02190 [Proteobacteria bacterium]|nr:hypothetical protein [Pseudomonadota bacterium]MBU1612398.1 hypothetical protein [Pseudomonadota bacterium]